jgi:hypothetical protein
MESRVHGEVCNLDKFVRGQIDGVIEVNKKYRSVRRTKWLSKALL